MLGTSWSWVRRHLVWVVAIGLVCAPAVLAMTPRAKPAARHAQAAAHLPACTIIGTPGPDRIVGTPGRDVICALGGDDVIRARGGNDVVFGGAGNDRIFGGRGNDRLYGVDGNDQLFGGPGNDLLQGSAGADRLSGGSGTDVADYSGRRGPQRISIGDGANDGFRGEGDDVRGDVENVRGGLGDDVLTGNGRRNVLWGGGGNDVLVGGGGADTLRGGSGADKLTGGAGNDTLSGGAGIDRLDGIDGASARDRLRCGPGVPDLALADGRDVVASSCEHVRRLTLANHAPTNIVLAPSSVAENQPAGTTVGTLTAVDRDHGDTERFVLAGGPDDGAFAITGSTLRTSRIFDFETKPVYAIRVRVTDRRGASFAKTLTVTVIDLPEHVNHAPTDITLSKSHVPENEPAGTTIGTLSAVDPDAGDSHTFALAGGPDDASFTIAGSTLKTNAVFDYETKKSYAIRVRTTDGSGATFEKALTIAVDDRNDPPNAVPAALTGIPEDGSQIVTLSASDPEGDPLTFSVANPLHGHVDTTTPAPTCDGLTPNHCTASVTYTPDANYNGPDSFGYTANDGTSDSPTAIVALVVDPVNDAPTATDGSASVAEDGSSPIDLTAFASDVETAAADLTYTIVSQPAHGHLSGGNAGPTYTPNADYNGADSFTYQVTDRGDPDGCSAAPCDAALSSAVKTVAITVTPVNDVPQAGDTTISTPEATAKSVDLTGLASDVETSAANLTYTIVDQPAHGHLSGSDANPTYTPNADYNGPDSFTYQVTDRGDPDNCGAVGPGCTAPESSSLATVSIGVQPVNSAPVASDSAVSGPEDSPLALDLGALVSDTETSDANLTYTIVSGPAHGTLTGTGPSRSYTPDPNFNGPDTFTYKVTDRGDPDNCGTPGAGCDAALSSATKTVSITVEPINDVPTAGDTSLSAGEDAPQAVDLSTLASDVETNPTNLTYAIVTGPAHGTLTGSGANWTYTAAADYNGPDSFTYQVTDRGDPDNCGATGPGCTAPKTSSVGTVAIAVAPVNDTPVADDGSISLAEDSSAPVDLGALVSDVETSDANLTYTIVSGPSHGQLTGAGATPTYTPDANFNGTDSFTYKVTDRGDPDNCSAAPCDAPASSATKTVSITVDPVNDAPTADDSSATSDEDTPTSIDLSASAADLETSAANLTYAIVTGPAHGTLTGSGANRTYTPNPDYTGSDAFTYTVTDRGDPDNCGAPGAGCDAPLTSTPATVSLTVNAVNDAPVNSLPAGPLTAVQDTDTPIAGLSVGDVDAGGDDVQATLSVAHGTLTVNTAAFGGVSPLQVTGNGTRTVVVTAPLAALNATFGDPNGVVYRGDSGYTGPDTLTMTSDDLGHNGSGGAKTDTDTLALDVVPPNQAPVAAAQNVSTSEDSGSVITLSATDADGDALTFAKGTGPSHGSLGSIGSATCDNATPSTCTASVTYTPDSNYNGSDSFTFTANDGTADSAPATVSIAVDPVNDAPVAGAGSATATEDSAGSIDLSAFASDVETSPANLTYTIVGAPTHGTLSGSGTSRTYTPDANYNGPDSFTYSVSDRGDPDNCGAPGPGCAAAKTSSSSGTVSITVNPVNDAPTANDSTLTTNEDQAGAVDLGALVSDLETSDANLAYTIIDIPTHGTLSGSGTSRTYTPDANYNGSDSFTYQVTDRGDPDNCSGGAPACDAAKTSPTRTIAITVNPVNDAPTVKNLEAGALAYTENDPATQITNSATVDDIDSANFDTGTLTVDWSSGGTVDDRLEIANQGQIATSGTNVTFGGTTIGTFAGGSGNTALVVTLNANATPAATEALVRAITYRNVSDDPSTAARTVRFVLTDGDGGTSAPATRGIALTAVNDPPALGGIETTAVNYIESVDSPPSQSQITNNLTISDPDSVILQGATVQITGACKPAEDVLVFSNQNTITGNYTAGTCLLTLTGTSSLANYQTALRSITYETTSDTPDTSTRTVTFQVDDGQSANHASNTQARDVTVTAANDSPTAAPDTYNGSNSALAGVTLAVGTSPSDPHVSISDNVLANDTDPDSPHADLTASAGTTSTNGGTVAMNPGGTFTYTPAPGYTGSDTFTYTVHDHGSPDRTGTGTVTINVAGPRVWFVNPGGSAGNGTSASPLNSLAPLSTGGASDSLDGNGDVIFVYQGTGNATSSGFVLEANQRLTGQPQGLSVTNANGTYNLVTGGGSNPTITNNSGAGLTLTDGNTVQRLDVKNASGVGVTGSGINTLTYGGNTTISGNGGGGLALSGAAGGAIDMGADISTTGGHSVSIASRNSGTTTLSGAINDTGTGISLTGNTGATINLTGGVTASTGGNAAFTAIGGGTVSVTGSANTLTTSTGTALDVESTTIGSANLTFRSITANGGSHGIVLIGTGSSGHLAVTGTGSAGTGGSITGITGADLATNNCGDLGSTAPVGVGVYLKNTSAPSLSYMTFPGTFGNFGILGYNVAGFNLDHSTLTGTYGDNVNVDDDTVHFCTLTGSASIANDTISGGAESNLRVVNASGAVLNRITISSTTFGLNQSTGGGGVLLEAGMDPNSNTGTLNATVTDSTFQGARGSPFQAVPQVGTSMDLVFGTPGHGNTIHNTHGNIVPFAQDLNVAAGGTLTFDINSNHFDSSSAVQAQGGVFINSAIGTATATGHFRNNTIGTSGVANSGSSGNDPGLDVESNGGGDLTIDITNNQMYQWGSNGAGFYVQVGQTFGNPTNVNVTATSNTIAEPGTFAVANNAQGFQLNNGTGTGDAPTTCLRFSGNTVDQAGTGTGGDVRLRQRFDSKVLLPGYTGSADGGGAGVPSVVSYVQGLNPIGPPAVTGITSTATVGGFFNTPGGAACAVPGF